jgi:hypothetical protein
LLLIIGLCKLLFAVRSRVIRVFNEQK